MGEGLHRAAVAYVVDIVMCFQPKATREHSILKHSKGILVGGLVKVFSHAVLLWCIWHSHFMCDAFFL